MSAIQWEFEHHYADRLLPTWFVAIADAARGKLHFLEGEGVYTEPSGSDTIKKGESGALLRIHRRVDISLTKDFFIDRKSNFKSSDALWVCHVDVEWGVGEGNVLVVLSAQAKFPTMPNIADIREVQTTGAVRLSVAGDTRQLPGIVAQFIETHTSTPFALLRGSKFCSNIEEASV